MMKNKVANTFKVLAVTLAVGAMPLAVTGSCDIVPGAVDLVIYGDGHDYDDDYYLDVYVDDGCCYYDDYYYDEYYIYEDDYYYWP